jgi:hypothetical protein
VGADNYFFLASAALVLCLASMAIGFGFSIDEFNLFGLKIKLPKAFALGPWKPFRGAAIVFGVAIAFLVILGVREKIDPDISRALRFSSLNKAEILGSEIDDHLVVKINGQQIIQADYGQTPSWTDVTRLMRRGVNAIEVIIQNGRYGGCGARVKLRLNGIILSGHDWAWGISSGDKTLKDPFVVCFQEVKSIHLQ